MYLSQVQQALAIRTAVEFWRTLRPLCMGTLYWQLNDNWPVASWASIDYYGNWKLLHYAAKRFYAPLLVTARAGEDGKVEFYAVNDAAAEFAGKLTVERFDFTGKLIGSFETAVTLASGSAAKLDTPEFPADEKSFLHYRLGDSEGDYFFAPFKVLELAEAKITVAPAGDDTWDLSTDAPAFFVALESDDMAVWSDNAFTLLPGRSRMIRKVRGEAGEPHIRHLGMIR